MVKLKEFLPHNTSLDLLDKLHGTVTVSRPTNVIASINRIYLCSTDVLLSVTSRYHDVVFKFEIFELEIEQLMSLPSTVDLGCICNWDKVGCLIRFEWQRPAKHGELPAGYGPVIGERGPRASIPDDALNPALSMVGILFLDSSRPLSAVAIDDVDGNIIHFIEKPHELEALTRQCEVVDLNQISQFSKNIQRSGA